MREMMAKHIAFIIFAAIGVFTLNPYIFLSGSNYNMSILILAYLAAPIAALVYLYILQPRVNKSNNTTEGRTW